MAGLPEVTITGTLVADPELRFTPSGVPVANFTIAANDRRFNTETKEWADGDATFLRCSIWRQPAEHVTESLTKGVRVLATGQLRQRSYETPEGQKRTVLELAVTEIGPSLKWATATITKAARTGNGDRARLPVEEDPWAARPTTTSSDDPPPF